MVLVLFYGHEGNEGGGGNQASPASPANSHVFFNTPKKGKQQQQQQQQQRQQPNKNQKKKAPAAAKQASKQAWVFEGEGRAPTHYVMLACALSCAYLLLPRMARTNNTSACPFVTHVCLRTHVSVYAPPCLSLSFSDPLPPPLSLSLSLSRSLSLSLSLSHAQIRALRGVCVCVCARRSSEPIARNGVCWPTSTHATQQRRRAPTLLMRWHNRQSGS